MNSPVKKFLFTVSTCALVAAALCLVSTISALAADQPHSPVASKTTKTPEKIAVITKGSSFTYQLEGRPDPFLPFLSEKAQANPDEILQPHEKLTGMQLFEPGQLTLVGLVRTPDRKLAMVQDVTGKGYIIKVGTKIGRRGVVTAIIPNKVVITETSMTRSGRKLTDTIVMVLRKEEKKK